MITLLNNTTVGVKVCGLRTEEDVDIAVGAGADAIGFMLIESSPRFIERHIAEQLLQQIPTDIIGVAVVQDHEDLLQFSTWNGWIQLCGNETEKEIAKAPCPVIKAFKWDEEQLLRWDACPNVEALLVDGSTGGLGKTFDLTRLLEIIPSLSKPVIIAGGLTPENIAQVIALASPVAVDVSSGIESSKGIKDHQKMCDFINAVKNA
jgi:phosphoribosylanthranilate isomerase